MYASVEFSGGRLYRSINGGSSFNWTGPGPLIPSGATGASSYTNALWVDPIDPNTVVVGGAYLFRTTQGGGGSWQEVSSTSTHIDHHVIVEDPGYNRTTNKIVYGGNDGGIYRTDNILLTCPSNCLFWTNLNHNLGITQFYGAAGHIATGKIIGGTQDNGTLRYEGNSEDWRVLFGALGGDGGFCAVDQSSDPYYYGEFTYLQIYRSTDGAFFKEYIWNGPYGIPHPPECGGVPCANFIAPFILDPNTTTRVLGGGRSLWRSNNVREPDPLQVSWAEIKSPIPPNCTDTNTCININAIAVADGYSNLIWVGHNDGSIYYTTNGTATTPSWTPVNGLPHDGGHMCTRITIAPDTLTKYVTFGGFNDDNVWKTQNNGGTWTKISNGLPTVPIYSLVVSQSNLNTLYIGTEVGVFATSDGGITWSPSSGGPANVHVAELFWMGSKLVAATHGRGLFTLTLPNP